MLIIKTQPAGIDWYIQQLQTKLHAGLIAEWELSDPDKYECYGRCYRNKKDYGYIAEVFTSGNEYKEVYWQDTLTALSFFGLSNNIKRGIQSEAEVHFVLFADLRKLALKNKSGAVIAHRADEELRQTVTDIIGKFSNGFTMLSTELWIENVLREYQGSRRDERLKVVDMHPVHSFRINLKLVYNESKNCQTLSIK